MPRKRRTLEQKIRILREAEGEKTILEVCEEHNLSEQTFHRWKRDLGPLFRAPGLPIFQAARVHLPVSGIGARCLDEATPGRGEAAFTPTPSVGVRQDHPAASSRRLVGG